MLLPTCTMENPRPVITKLFLFLFPVLCIPQWICDCNLFIMHESVPQNGHCTSIQNLVNLNGDTWLHYEEFGRTLTQQQLQQRWILACLYHYKSPALSMPSECIRIDSLIYNLWWNFIFFVLQFTGVRSWLTKTQALDVNFSHHVCAAGSTCFAFGNWPCIQVSSDAMAAPMWTIGPSCPICIW